MLETTSEMVKYEEINLGWDTTFDKDKKNSLKRRICQAVYEEVNLKRRMNNSSEKQRESNLSQFRTT